VSELGGVFDDNAPHGYSSTDSAQMIAPAGVAGVVAIKPTVGRVSRTGVVPVARSQDSPGPICPIGGPAS